MAGPIFPIPIPVDPKAQYTGDQKEPDTGILQTHRGRRHNLDHPPTIAVTGRQITDLYQWEDGVGPTEGT